MTGGGIGPWRRWALLVGACVAGGGAAAAIAAVPGSDGSITACLKTVGASGLPDTAAPNLTVIDPAQGQTCGPAGAAPSARTITWSVTGPPGATGPQGPPGVTGATGPTGPPVPAGTGTGTAGTGTVSAGTVLTLPGGTQLTLGIGGAQALVLAPGRGRIATATLGSGRNALIIAVRALEFFAGAGAVTGSGAAKSTVHDIQITKTIDKSSPTLLQACATGKHFPSATITLVQKGKTIRYSLQNVFISSDQVAGAGSGGSEIPLESLTLNFTKLQISYKA